MRKCGGCGFPRRIGRFCEWHSDGTLAGALRPKIAFIFLEVAEWDSIYERLSSALGIPLDRIVLEAQKNIGKGIHEMIRAIHHINLKRIPANRLIRPKWLISLIIRSLRRDLAFLGAGSPSVDDYRAGEYLVIRMTDPWVNPIVVGNCLGIYESTEDMPGSDAEYWVEGGDLIMRLSHAKRKEELEERLYLEEATPGEGSLSYERCPECGVPMMIARALEWDIKRGIIRNRLSGEREEIVAVESINSIMRELEKELGGEVWGILYEAQKDYSGRVLKDKEIKNVEVFWDHYLQNMGLRGLGYPERFDRSHDSITVEIKPAYNQVLYAAKLAAGFEKATGRRSRTEWEVRELHQGRYKISAID